ncbi:unnamed protein product, partial [Protopolystoma xenopodis]
RPPSGSKTREIDGENLIISPADTQLPAKRPNLNRPQDRPQTGAFLLANAVARTRPVPIRPRQPNDISNACVSLPSQASPLASVVGMTSTGVPKSTVKVATPISQPSSSGPAAASGMRLLRLVKGIGLTETHSHDPETITSPFPDIQSIGASESSLTTTCLGTNITTINTETMSSSSFRNSNESNRESLISSHMNLGCLADALISLRADFVLVKSCYKMG